MNKTIIHVTYSTAVQFTENKVLVRMYLEIPYAETINPKLRKVKDSLFFFICYSSPGDHYKRIYSQIFRPLNPDSYLLLFGFTLTSPILISAKVLYSKFFT